MSGDIAIRDYHPKDASALLELMRELQADLIPMLDRMLPLDRIGPCYREKVLAGIAEAKGRALVAEADGRLLGYATVLIEVESAEIDEVAYTYAHVGELLVTTAARGGGVGTRLLAECERIAREGGAKWLRVEVLGSNHGARRLYGRLGFGEYLVELEKPLTPKP